LLEYVRKRAHPGTSKEQEAKVAYQLYTHCQVCSAIKNLEIALWRQVNITFQKASILLSNAQILHQDYIPPAHFRVCLEPRKEAEVISEILLKAASEPEFRNSLIRDPANVLQMYDVSPQAKTIITKSINDLTQ
jgi:hypothetical protein